MKAAVRQAKSKSGPARLPRCSHKISTLLYCFNEEDEVLLLERTRPPNLGLWSPPGGKLQTEEGESPYACACREAGEEMRLSIGPADLHLSGIVSEHGYEGQSHWLMFLFEIKPRLKQAPPAHREGRFQFFSRSAIRNLSLPETDRDQIWPCFWKYRGGFFAAHCLCQSGGRYKWRMEECWKPS